MQALCCRGSRVGYKEQVVLKLQAARPFAFAQAGSAATELLRRERGDDFFEARLAAQRVPPWHQF